MEAETENFSYEASVDTGDHPTITILCHEKKNKRRLCITIDRNLTIRLDDSYLGKKSFVLTIKPLKDVFYYRTGTEKISKERQGYTLVYFGANGVDIINNEIFEVCGKKGPYCFYSEHERVALALYGYTMNDDLCNGVLDVLCALTTSHPFLMIKLRYSPLHHASTSDLHNMIDWLLKITKDPGKHLCDRLVDILTKKAQ